MSGKNEAVNKRASKFQARRIFYHNSVGRKVQYENFRLHLVPLLISNLLSAYDPTNFLPPALRYLPLSFPPDSTLIMQEFLLLNPLGERSVPDPAYKRGNPLSTEHAPTFLAKFKLNDPTLWPCA